MRETVDGERGGLIVVRPNIGISHSVDSDQQGVGLRSAHQTSPIDDKHMTGEGLCGIGCKKSHGLSGVRRNQRTFHPVSAPLATLRWQNLLRPLHR